MANDWDDFEIDPSAEAKFLAFARRHRETSTLHSASQGGQKLTAKPGLNEILAGGRAKKTAERLWGGEGKLSDKVLAALKRQGQGQQEEQDGESKKGKPFPWVPKKPPLKPSREYKRLKKRLDKVHARVISRYTERTKCHQKIS